MTPPRARGPWSRRASPLLLGLGLLAAGCDSLWGAFRVPHPGPCSGDDSCRSATFQLRPAVNILVVLDNSASMLPHQMALAERMTLLLRRAEQLGVDYHLGVVTTDVGAWPAGAAGLPPWAGCGSAAGDDGVMQVMPCTARGGPPELAAACKMWCPDGARVPGQGVPYIFHAADGANVPSMVADGYERGPLLAFRCLALMGQQGCELEGPLEAMRRALSQSGAANQGFLANDAALLVLIVTDEDDCSVQAARRGESDPAARLNCQAGEDDYRCFNPDLRCLAQAVRCAEPLTTPGVKTGCQLRDSSYLEPVDSYAQFLKGLRPARKLLVAGVWPPALGGADSRLVLVTAPGGTAGDSYDLNRATVAPDVSCAGAAPPPYTLLSGRPQLRLSRFAAALGDSATEISACSFDGLGVGLTRLGERLGDLTVDCLDYVPRSDGGRPRCLVGDVPSYPEGQLPQAPLPLCGDGCCAAYAQAAQPVSWDPAVAAACQGEAGDCYCAPASQAGACPGGAVAAVWRKARPLSTSQVVSFTCSAP